MLFSTCTRKKKLSRSNILDTSCVNKMFYFKKCKKYTIYFKKCKKNIQLILRNVKKIIQLILRNVKKKNIQV